jgi:hypothetical protein
VKQMSWRRSRVNTCRRQCGQCWNALERKAQENRETLKATSQGTRTLMVCETNRGSASRFARGDSRHFWPKKSDARLADCKLVRRWIRTSVECVLEVLT